MIENDKSTVKQDILTSYRIILTKRNQKYQSLPMKLILRYHIQLFVELLEDSIALTWSFSQVVFTRSLV